MRPVAGGEADTAGRYRSVSIPIVIVLIVAFMYRVTPEQAAETLPLNTGDPSLNTWILSWQAHALVADPSHWFDGNIFVTHGMALGYSETMLPLVPPFGLFYLASGSPVVAHNLLVVVLLWFSMAMTYRLARVLSLSRMPALLSATAFTFNAFTFAHLGHLQLLTFGFFPLGMLCLLRLLERRRVRDGLWFGAASGLLIMACLYYAVVWVAMVAMVLLADLVRLRLRPDRTWRRAVGAGLASATVCSAPILGLYVWFQTRVNFTRTIPRGSSFSLIDIATPSSGSTWYRSSGLAALARPTAPEHTFFPGLVAAMLASVTAVLLVMRIARAVRRAPERSAVMSVRWGLVVAGGATALAVASAPGLPGIGSAITSAYERLPGLSSIRVPARLALPAMLAIALAAGRGLQLLDGSLRPRMRSVVPGALLALTMFDLSAAVPRADVRPTAAQEALYEAVAALPGGRVIELPAASGKDGAVGVYSEAPRMLHSIGDWRGRFNGTSGGDPPGFGEDVAVANTFPSDDAVELLRRGEVRYVVLHGPTDVAGEGMSQDVVDAALAAYGDLVIARFDGVVVFDLEAAITSPGS